VRPVSWPIRWSLVIIPSTFALKQEKRVDNREEDILDSVVQMYGNSQVEETSHRSCSGAT
jgi:hypothetical protein